MSSISSGTTRTTALVQTADTSGVLQLQTNGTTTAVTIDTNQNFGLAGQLSIGSTATTLGFVDITATSSTAQLGLRIAGTNTFAGIPAGLRVAYTLTGTAATTSGYGIQVTPTYAYAAGANISDSYGIDVQPQLNGTVTPGVIYGVRSFMNMGASATGGTISNWYQYHTGGSVFNASATTNITNAYGYFSANIANGAAQTITNAYAFYGNQASGSGRYNFYAAGTADNYFAGNLLVGQSSTIGTGGRVQVISNTDTLYSQTSSTTTYAALVLNVQNTSARLAAFQYGNTTTVGTITTNGTTTSYNVSSDYRLKENIVPLTGALAKILQLKPSTYNYKSKPEESIEGFIAHELQSVIPHAVTGDKDAVDADEKPIYQGVDASFLIPHLVAATQELSAQVTTLQTQVTALQAKG